MERTVNEKDIKEKKCYEKDISSDRYLDLVTGVVETESECILEESGRQFVRIISSKRRYPVEATINMNSPNDCIEFENNGSTHQDIITIAPAIVGSNSKIEKNFDIESIDQSSMGGETISVSIDYGCGSDSSSRSGPQVTPKVELSDGK